jgi:hypothetical protein
LKVNNRIVIMDKCIKVEHGLTKLWFVWNSKK